MQMDHLSFIAFNMHPNEPTNDSRTKRLNI